uniref:U49-Deinotoxin-Dsu1a_3 n=1 Tax=Deinopis subrufa TaxID=1905329 RepID=A0A4Q8K7P6_DEISU
MKLQILLICAALLVLAVAESSASEREYIQNLERMESQRSCSKWIGDKCVQTEDCCRGLCRCIDQNCVCAN